MRASGSPSPALNLPSTLEANTAQVALTSAPGFRLTRAGYAQHMQHEKDTQGDLEQARRDAEMQLREALSLNPRVRVWMATDEELNQILRPEITKLDLDEACLGVSTRHSRHLVLCHTLLGYYTLGPDLPEPTEEVMEMFRARMALAEVVANDRHEREVRRQLMASYPGLQFWEVEVMLSAALRYSRFKRLYWHIAHLQDSAEVALESCQEMLLLLHGEASESTTRKCSMTADWFTQIAMDLSKANSLHPAYLAYRLKLRRHDLSQWEKTVPADLELGTQLLDRKRPHQFDRRAVASARAFVAHATKQASKAKIGSSLVDPGEDYTVKESAGNRLLMYFEKEVRAHWKRPRERVFFQPGEATALAALFAQEGKVADAQTSGSI